MPLRSGAARSGRFCVNRNFGRLRRCLWRPTLATAAALFWLWLAGAESPPAIRTVGFAKDIQPLLAASCYECHGPEKQKGGLRVDLKAAALKG